jgi:hypothetical protein
MARSVSPATIVICATLQAQMRGERCDGLVRGAASLSVPVTWVTAIDRLADVGAEIARRVEAADVAVNVPVAECSSRQRLRRFLVRAREALPTLTAAALRGSAAFEHRSLLVGEGIGVVLVDALEEQPLGPRRPAPRGWPCRNTAWGLWEVQVGQPRAAAWARWFGLSGLQRPRPGSLHVLRTDGAMIGNNGEGFLTSRLERWAGWAERRCRHGAAVATTLSGLGGALARGGRGPLAGSVLRAA